MVAPSSAKQAAFRCAHTHTKWMFIHPHDMLQLHAAGGDGRQAIRRSLDLCTSVHAKQTFPLVRNACRICAGGGDGCQAMQMFFVHVHKCACQTNISTRS